MLPICLCNAEAGVLPHRQMPAGGTKSLQLSRGPSRRMSDMQDINRVFAHTIKYTKWITYDSDDAHLRSLRDSRSGFRIMGNAADDVFEPSPDGFGYRETGTGSVVRRNLMEISELPSRIDELHAERNFAKAVLISASVAASPASIDAMAASMIRNSSRVA